MSKEKNPIIDQLLGRASCRAFEDRQVEQQVLDTILSASIQAPSGGNIQPWSVIVLQDVENRKRMAEYCGGDAFIHNAPVNMLFCMDWNKIERMSRLHMAPFAATHSLTHFLIAFMDTVIAAQTAVTAAEALGLGCVFVGTPVYAITGISEAFHLPKGVLPVLLVVAGYPRFKLDVQKKSSVEIMVFHEQYPQLSDEVLRDAFSEKFGRYQFPLDEEKMAAIYQSAKDTSGAEYADMCIESIRQAGAINMLQFGFGLHYRADEMVARNPELMEAITAQGFGIFQNGMQPDKHE